MSSYFVKASKGRDFVVCYGRTFSITESYRGSCRRRLGETVQELIAAVVGEVTSTRVAGVTNPSDIL